MSKELIENKIFLKFSKNYLTIENLSGDEILIFYTSITRLWIGGYFTNSPYVCAELMLDTSSGTVFLGKIKELITPDIEDKINPSNDLYDKIMSIKLAIFDEDFRKERVTNEKDFIIELNIIP